MRSGRSLRTHRGRPEIRHSQGTLRFAIGAGGPPPEGLPYFTYAVSPDGERFLIPRMSQTADEKSRALTVVLNWQEELKRRVTAR